MCWKNARFLRRKSLSKLVWKIRKGAKLIVRVVQNCYCWHFAPFPPDLISVTNPASWGSHTFRKYESKFAYNYSKNGKNPICINVSNNFIQHSRDMRCSNHCTLIEEWVFFSRGGITEPKAVENWSWSASCPAKKGGKERRGDACPALWWNLGRGPVLQLL